MLLYLQLNIMIMKHYQNKFTTEKEAVADAKQMSRELKKPMAVIKSKKLYYTDSDTTPHSWEELIGIYKDGKKV